MRPGHADEAVLLEPGTPAAPVLKQNTSAGDAVRQVERVAVAQNIDAIESEPFSLAPRAERQREPIRQVYERVVFGPVAVDFARQPVVASRAVSPWIVIRVSGGIGGASACQEHAITER